MAIHYRAIQPDDLEPVRQFLSTVGWAKRVNDARRFEELIANTDRTVVAFENGQVVGFVRALCDNVSNGYISMLAVAEKYRRQGIGTELVRRLVGEDTNLTWVLRAGRESKVFWTKVGFLSSAMAMERVRSK